MSNSPEQYWVQLLKRNPCLGLCPICDSRPKISTCHSPNGFGIQIYCVKYFGRYKHPIIQTQRMSRHIPHA